MTAMGSSASGSDSEYVRGQMQVRIRPYRSADLQALTDIYNESVLAGGVTADLDPQTIGERREWVDSHAPRSLYPVVVLEVGGRVAGFASLSRFLTRPGYDGVVELSYYVAAGHRRRGYGSMLLDELLRLALGAGHRMAVALIFDVNEGSQALMRSHGFTRFGLLPSASFDGQGYLDLAYWYRNLDGAGTRCGVAGSDR